eukprot:GHVS01055781.1.p1 GENE.GHVS01055781.1~~GHVS01055781.1.p1  ORF type:complete len:205 (+),score=57.15 GHVS01055781.1:967-1581(+)
MNEIAKREIKMEESEEQDSGSGGMDLWGHNKSGGLLPRGGMSNEEEEVHDRLETEVEPMVTKPDRRAVKAAEETPASSWSSSEYGRDNRISEVPAAAAAQQLQLDQLTTEEKGTREGVLAQQTTTVSAAVTLDSGGLDSLLSDETKLLAFFRSAVLSLMEPNLHETAAVKQAEKPTIIKQLKEEADNRKTEEGKTITNYARLSR